MSAQHTPWRIEPNGGAFNVVNAIGNIVCMYADESEASLIAAAPELLALVERAVAEEESHGLTLNWMCDARAALAKVRP